MRILIVDDDRALRDALRRALVLGGYETVPVESGEEALAEIARIEPDAVVLDIGLPDVDGSTGSMRAPTTTWSSRSTWASCGREFARCCGAAA